MEEGEFYAIETFGSTGKRNLDIELLKEKAAASLEFTNV